MVSAIARIVGAVLMLLGVAFGTAIPIAHSQGEGAAEVTSLAAVQREVSETRSRLEQWQAKATEFAALWANAPQRIAELDQDIARLEASKEITIPEDTTAKGLDRDLAAAERELSVAREGLLLLDSDASKRADRRRGLPDVLKLTQSRLLDAQEKHSAPTGSDPEVAAAQSELSSLRQAALQAEVDAYNNEISSYEARGVLLGKKRDRAVLTIAHFERLTQALREALKFAQERVVEEAASETDALMAGLGTSSESVRQMVEDLASQNAQLAARWTGEDGVGRKIDDVTEKLARAEEQIADVDAALSNLQEQIAAVGLADSVGLLLRRQRTDAPDVGMYRRFIRMRQPVIGKVQLEQIQLRERRQSLTDIDAAVDSALADAQPPIAAEERERIEGVLHDLLMKQRDYLDELVDDYETYFEKLVDFDARQRELVDRTETLTDFIDARVLWVPSGRSVKAQTFVDGGPAFGWLISPKFWEQFRRGARDAWVSHRVLNVFVALLMLLSLLAAPRVRRRIEALGKDARSYRTTTFAPTMEALGLTLLLVPWLSGGLIYFGWRLGASPIATEFTRCFATGMVAAGIFWTTLRLVSGLLRHQGIADAHAGLPSDPVRIARFQLLAFELLTVPAVFLIFIFEAHGEDPWTESVGRLTFIAAMVVTALFTYLAFRPNGPFLGSFGPQAVSRKRARLGLILRTAAVLVPVLLALVAARGYYWTALQLAFRQHITLLLFFTLLIGFRLSLRWSVLARRRVARDQAAQGEEEAEEEAVDLVTVEAQTARLIRGTAYFIAAIGLVVIWAEVLPAAGLLHDIELWNTTQNVTATVQDASGQSRGTIEKQVVPVTLADLFTSLLIAAIALALVRNLPGLLEVSLFRRLKAGERYAFATLVKYAIAMIGIALAFGAIGIGWSNIQWLIAAVGVGLGFGLQEIFANFISGLIILFERPIRVGDTVTVGTVSGTVTRIRTRATWITGFDRRELVVPNKEFITQQLLNWSLSDSVMRVTVDVGIAYGSDTEKAVEVLGRVAGEHPVVLHEPAPQVLFLGFGDSSLSFELRVFLPDVTDFAQIRHDLHMAIDAAFREADIEIAFPQRDIHVRTLQGNWQPAKAS